LVSFKVSSLIGQNQWDRRVEVVCRIDWVNGTFHEPAFNTGPAFFDVDPSLPISMTAPLSLVTVGEQRGEYSFAGWINESTGEVISSPTMSLTPPISPSRWWVMYDMPVIDLKSAGIGALGGLIGAGAAILVAKKK